MVVNRVPRSSPEPARCVRRVQRSSTSCRSAFRIRRSLRAILSQSLDCPAIVLYCEYKTVSPDCGGFMSDNYEITRSGGICTSLACFVRHAYSKPRYPEGSGNDKWRYDLSLNCFRTRRSFFGPHDSPTMAFRQSGCFCFWRLSHDQMLQAQNPLRFLRCPDGDPFRQFPAPPP